MAGESSFCLSFLQYCHAGGSYPIGRLAFTVGRKLQHVQLMMEQRAMVWGGGRSSGLAEAWCFDPGGKAGGEMLVKSVQAAPRDVTSFQMIW